MTVDNRLYAQLTLDFASNPKIKPLSDKAFRHYIEALLWSRTHLTDGFIEEKMAAILFNEETLKELLTNNQKKSSIKKIKNGYKIHDFEQHQMTNEKIEKKRQSGRLGGYAKSSSSKNLARARNSPQQKASTPLASTEYRVQSTEYRETLSKKESRTAKPIDPEFQISDTMKVWAKVNAPLVDIEKVLPEFIDYWTGEGGKKVDWVSTWRNSMRRKQEFVAKANPQRASVRKFQAHDD